MKLVFENVPDEYAASLKKVMDEVLESLKEWPKNGDMYYSICGQGNITTLRWSNDRADNALKSFGNCFKTKEDAEFKLEQLKVLHELEELADDDLTEWDYHETHFYLYYDHERDQVLINHGLIYQYSTFCFKTLKSVSDAIDKIGADRLKKYYFCVPEEKK